jgi:hypothetical protein
MAKNQNKRLATSTLAEDETAFNALQNVTGYTPANPAYAVTAITQAFADMRAAQAAEDQVAAALATARNHSVEKEWAVHNLMLGVKDQVKAQFGKDSTQLQELGLKRVSEYKSRKPRSSPPPQ